MDHGDGQIPRESSRWLAPTHSTGPLRPAPTPKSGFVTCPRNRHRQVQVWVSFRVSSELILPLTIFLYSTVARTKDPIRQFSLITNHDHQEWVEAN